MRSRHTLSLIRVHSRIHTHKHIRTHTGASTMFSRQHINTQQQPKQMLFAPLYRGMHTPSNQINVRHSLARLHTHSCAHTHSHIGTLRMDRFLDSRSRMIWNYFCFCSRQWTSTQTRPLSFVVRFCFILFVFKISVSSIHSFTGCSVWCTSSTVRSLQFDNFSLIVSVSVSERVCFCLFIFHKNTFRKKSAKSAWKWERERKKFQKKSSNFCTSKILQWTSESNGIAMNLIWIADFQSRIDSGHQSYNKNNNQVQRRNSEHENIVD